MSKLAIISHTEHYYDSKGEIVGWEPTIREINHFSTIFDLAFIQARGNFSANKKPSYNN